ncbi:MAG: response regulator [Bacillota bacterium]
MKALIVDDAMMVRFVLKKFLASIGFDEVFEAGTGKEALVLYKEHRPDIVTMDITMPEMDGLQSIEAIMAEDPQARIVVCSAIGQRDYVLKAMELGAKNYLIKPFQEEKVIETIKLVMGI